MRPARRHLLIAALLLVALLLAGYWWASPYLVVRRMVDAAEAGDAERFNSRIDYPRLRESLKAQLAARVQGSATDTPGERNPLAGLGRAIGLAMVDPVVDTMVRPEVVMLALRQRVRMQAPPSTSRAAPEPTPAQTSPPQDKPRWRLEREGLDRVRLLPPEDAAPASSATLPRPASLVLERRGFADWKLVEMRLAPAS
jgi:hypothetical protein